MKSKSLTFEELRVKNQTRCETIYHSVDEWSETDWSCALSGETGELANFIKKRRRKDFKTKAHVGSIKKEIGDVCAYLDLLATKFGLRLEDCIRDKFNEVSEKAGCEIKL